MSHALVAIIEAERARQRRRVLGAETELKQLCSQPIAAGDGDEDGPGRDHIDRARLIDRTELELERARAAAEALQALWVRTEEEQAMKETEPAHGFAMAKG